MIPRTEIIYNYDYAKRLYRGQENFEDVWRRIIGLGADFEMIYEKYNSHILALIEKYSGFAWDGDIVSYLPVYMTESRPSFAHPLTLAVDEDPTLMLRDYTYQLAHCNLSFGFKTDELRLHCLELITNQVMSDLVWQKPEKVGEWDLTKMTLKEYLSK